MRDAEISCKVASVMWPEYEWYVSRQGLCTAIVEDTDMQVELGTDEVYMSIYFDYLTDDALGEMCVWFANEDNSYDLVVHLREDNPHRALADAIIEMGDK